MQPMLSRLPFLRCPLAKNRHGLAKTDARGIRAQIIDRAERQQLEAALHYVREGDSFTVTKLDRLA